MSKTRGVATIAVVVQLALVPLLAPSPGWAAPARTQTIPLHEGWNAVYLEVKPPDPDPAVVFAGVPLESVWTWADKGTPAQFIQDLAEERWSGKGWLVHFTDPANAHLNTLTFMPGNTAYLVKLARGSAPATLTVTGTPATAPTKWHPDTFNLVGFPVNPAVPVSFAAYFAPSRAHAGQAVYRLAGDAWQFVDDPGATTINPGEAYYVYCDGGSDYQGLLTVTTPTGGTLEYGRSVGEIRVVVANRGDQPSAYGIADLGSANPVSLLRRDFSEATGNFAWAPLLPFAPAALAAGRIETLAVGIDRTTLGAVGETVLAVTDDRGMRIFVPVTAAGVAP